MIIPAEELYRKLDDRDLVVLDCSTQSNQAGKESDYLTTKIKGARYFDLQNSFSDLNSEFPNTLPTPEQFEANCRKIGIDNSSDLVLYDNLGIYSSPRVWWMFKIMGHKKISVLNGGLPEWINNNYPTQENYDPVLKEGNFKSDFQQELISDFKALNVNLEKDYALVIDARSPGRFTGIDPEPRKALRSGSIPFSVNIPFEEVLDGGKYKEKDALKSVFKSLENESRELIFTCGSGVTACIVYLASELVLPNKKSVYDGSWTEWASLTA